MTRPQANLLLLAAGAIWGMGFIAQSTAMSAIEPFSFLAVRFAIAALVIAPFAIREGKKTPNSLQMKDWLAFLFIGCILFLAMATQQFGLLSTSVTNSGFLTGLYVVFTPILSVVIYRVWPHWVVWPCAMLAFLGIFMLSGGKFSALTHGDNLTIVSAVFWALQVLFIVQLANRTGRPITFAVVQFALCSVIGLVLAVMYETLPWQSIVEAAPELLFTGIFSSGVAFTLQAIGQRHTTAPQAAIFLSSETLFAALFAALMLGERIGAIGLMGCLAIFVSMLLIEFIPIWRLKKMRAQDRNDRDIAETPSLA